MGKSDGFDLFVGPTKIGSFQTSIQDDGTREMYTHLNDGSHFHLGAQEIDGVIGRSFGRASHLTSTGKVYAGDGVIRETRSTEDIARFVVERTTDGAVRTFFTQGEFRTEPVETTGLNPSRESRTLPWDETWKRVEYGIGLYDVNSDLSSGSSQIALQYSSDSTGFGISLTVRATERFNTED